MRLFYWLSENMRTVATWAAVLAVVFILGVCTGLNHVVGNGWDHNRLDHPATHKRRRLMRVIYWLSENMRTVATWAAVLAVVFILGVCTGVANAQSLTYNSQPLRDYFQPGSSTIPLTSHDPDVAPNGSAWMKQTMLDGTWTVPTAPCGAMIFTICAANTDGNNVDQRIIIDTGVNDHWLYNAVLEWNAGLTGVVVSASLDNQNWIMIWYDDTVPVLNVGKLVNGSFSLVTSAACDANGATGIIRLITLKEGTQYTIFAFCEVSGLHTLTPVIADASVISQTHVGLFNRNSTTNYWGELEFRANILPVEPDAVDFTPFLYASAFLLGIAFIGVGEYARQMMYTTLGGLIIIGSAIATGLTWLMILTGIGFLAVGYRAIVLFFKERSAVE